MLSINFIFVISLIMAKFSRCDEVLDQSCDCELMKPFEWNCNKYYHCDGSQLFIRDCPAGLHFNETLQQCVYPSQSGCNQDSICLPTTTTMTTPATTTTAPTPAVCDVTRGCFHKMCKEYVDVMAVDVCSADYYMCEPLGQCYCLKHCEHGLIFDPPAEIGGGYCVQPSLVEGCNKTMYDVLRWSTELLGNPSEFNKPRCTWNPTGECPTGMLNRGCEKKFRHCENGWTCEYFCKDDLVYNSKSNHCQDLHSCHKSMRYDL